MSSGGRRKSYSSKFQSAWLISSKFPQYADWLRRDSSSKYSAFCTLCDSSFSVARSGKGQVDSHAKGKGHKQRVEQNVSGQIRRQQTTASSAATSQIPAVSTIDEEAPSTTMNSDEDESMEIPSTPISSANSDDLRTKRRRIVWTDDEDDSLDERPSFRTQPSEEGDYLDEGSDGQSSYRTQLSEDSQQVAKAEILAVLYVLRNQQPYSFLDDFAEKSAAMVPDSKIAASLQIDRTKAACMVSYGLAPYFKDRLLADIKSSPVLSVCFEEALNKVSQRGQMDLIVRYWDEKEYRVNARYLTSVFGYTTHRHTDLLRTFYEGTEDLDQEKILQVSLDGPSVEHQFLDKLKEQSESGLLDIGTCGLYVVHGAFKAGHHKVKWVLSQFLRSLYDLFKNSLWIRGEYTDITDSNKFPKKFRAHRWLDNRHVIEHALEILPNVRKYVAEVETKPDADSFDTVSDGLRDDFLEAKLEFFKDIAVQLEPLLTKFQTRGPSASLLYDHLKATLRDLLIRIVNEGCSIGQNERVAQFRFIGSVVSKVQRRRRYRYRMRCETKNTGRRNGRPASPILLRLSIVFGRSDQETLRTIAVEVSIDSRNIGHRSGRHFGFVVEGTKAILYRFGTIARRQPYYDDRSRSSAQRVRRRVPFGHHSSKIGIV